MKKPFVFAVSGVKNSGKTTLISKLIPIFAERGIKTAVIKHDGHEFQADVPGTDSYIHLQSGAYGTAVFSDSRFMMVKQQKIDEQQLFSYFPEADLFLLEGFKASDYPKIEIVRKGNSKQPVCPRENLAAVFSDFLPEGCGDIPVFDLNTPNEAADFILSRWYARDQISLILLAGGMSSRMGRDKADLLYESQTFLTIQIEKGRRLGIEDILVSGYQGNLCSQRIVEDRFKQKGPLGGLEASLRQAKHKRCLILSVDTPRVTIGALQHLIMEDYANACQRNAVRIIQHGEKQEPLIGIYPADLADLIEEELKNGQRSVFSLLKKIGFQVCQRYDNEEQFQNINSPKKYQIMLNSKKI